MLKYWKTELINTAYLEQGAVENPVILLLHGWPDDASTWDQLMPKMSDNGYRTIVPWLRGFGEMTFLQENIPRTGNPGIIALDMIELMDSLNIEQLNIVGHDWRANVAEAIAIGWPDRVNKVAFISSPPGFGDTPAANFKHAQLQWYHWFMATKIGEKEVCRDPIAFARIMWENWAPVGWFKEETYQEVSKSWLNPDFTAVTLHSYRSRWGEEEVDEKSRELEMKIRAIDKFKQPALYDN